MTWWFLTQNFSIGKGKIPGCSFILSVGSRTETETVNTNPAPTPSELVVHTQTGWFTNWHTTDPVYYTHHSMQHTPPDRAAGAFLEKALK